MLSKHPASEREEQATSPALARRRDHMLRNDATRHVESRLVPASDEDQPNFLPGMDFDVAENEPAPDIPPPPAEALRAGREDCSERPNRSPRSRRLWLPGAALGVIAVGFITWLVYDKVPVKLGSGEVPFVAADTTPEKIRPQQEGGIEVPNQDIRVYDELNGTKSDKKGEVLLPPPEAPVAPPTAPDTKPETATATPA